MLWLCPLKLAIVEGGQQKSFMMISYNECVDACLGDLGIVNRTFGHWKHKVEGSLVEMVPEFLRRLGMKFFGPFVIK